MLKERVLEITKELVKIYSPTNTAEEQKVEQYLLNLLQGMPYFKAHPELCGAFAAADDCFQRSTIYGLVLGKSKKTVVFMGHHDVVSTEVYGALAQLATEPEALAQELHLYIFPFLSPLSLEWVKYIRIRFWDSLFHSYFVKILANPLGLAAFLPHLSEKSFITKFFDLKRMRFRGILVVFDCRQAVAFQRQIGQKYRNFAI